MHKIRPFYFPKMIRIGSQNDAGYVIPDPLNFQPSKQVSFGFGYNADFELEAV